MNHPGRCCFRDLRMLCTRLFTLGLATGVLSGGLLLGFQMPLARLATRDAESQAKLAGWVWPLVCLAQPVNAGVKFTEVSQIMRGPPASWTCLGCPRSWHNGLSMRL
jgi:Na+-driven multidrug efflux pump